MLQKKMDAQSRGHSGDDVHVPYRNSLMTTVLKDSLGGNCMTRMVATIRVEDDYLYESIFTCKFAMRVAMIKNTVRKNESTDPAIVIQRLKRENSALKAEIAMLRGEDVKDLLSEEEVEHCRKITKQYLEGGSEENSLVVGNRLMIEKCFSFLKIFYKEKIGNDKGKRGDKEIEPGLNSEDKLRFQDEIMKLKLILQQRENEIVILLNLINKKGGGGGGNPAGMDVVFDNDGYTDPGMEKLTFPSSDQPNSPQNKKFSKKNQSPENSQNTEPKYGVTHKPWSQIESASLNPSQNNSKYQNPDTAKLKEINKLLKAPIQVTKDQLMNRHSCMEMFRRSYRKMDALNEDMLLLKQLFSKGQEKTQEVKKYRSEIEYLKNKIEDVRKMQALRGISSGNEIGKSQEEEELQKMIEIKKKNYRETMSDVKDTKNEISRLKLTLENAREKMQRDFEKWLYLMMKDKGISSQKNLKSNSQILEERAPTRDATAQDSVGKKVNRRIIRVWGQNSLRGEVGLRMMR